MISDKGLFTALKIGQTKISSNKATCNVTVIPYYNTVEEPHYLYGSSVAEIKAKEKRTLLSETSTSLVFEGENDKVDFVIYLLNEDKLVEVGVFFKPVTGILREIRTFFKERYIYVDEKNGYSRVIDSKNIMVLIRYDDVLGNHAIYTRYKVVSNPSSHVKAPASIAGSSSIDTTEEFTKILKNLR